MSVGLAESRRNGGQRRLFGRFFRVPHAPPPQGHNESLEAQRLDRVRIDKWLWAARFFKTRSLASKACELGRIECHGMRVKPSRDLKAGDALTIRNDAGEFQIEVLELSEMRGPAPAAQKLYRETEASRQARAIAAEQRRAGLQFDFDYDGRPSKRDRRQMDRVKFPG